MRSTLPTCLLLAMCILTCWLASQSFLEPSQLSSGRAFVGWICVLSTPAVFSGTAICVAFSQGSVSIRLLSGCCISYLYCLCSLIILGKLLVGETMPDTIELILFSATPIFKASFLKAFNPCNPTLAITVKYLGFKSLIE